MRPVPSYGFDFVQRFHAFDVGRVEVRIGVVMAA